MQATLLVDPVSRVQSTIEIVELKRFGINIISDLKEMLKGDYDGHPVLILSGFVQTESGVSDLILYQRLVGLKYIFISDDETLLRQMSRHAKTYAFNVDYINYKLLLSAINDDQEAYRPFMVEPEDKYTALANMILENAGFMDKTLKDMASCFLSVLEDNKRLYASLSGLRAEYDLVCGMNENKAHQLTYINEQMDAMLRQTVSVNDALSAYSFICQKDVYKKVSLSEFKNKPYIIYFKEYGDFLHLTTFIYTLTEVMRRQYDIPVKVLWVMDKNNPMRLKYVPSYYSIFSDGVYNKPTIQISDYMCTTSGYDGILQTICENQAGAEYLVVVDTKLVDDTVLAVSDILRYDLCRDVSKIRNYGLLDLRTIVNNEEGRELSWNHFYDYHNLNEEDRFLYLSNRPVIRSIMKTAQREFSIR